MNPENFEDSFEAVFDPFRTFYDCVVAFNAGWPALGDSDRLHDFTDQHFAGLATILVSAPDVVRFEHVLGDVFRELEKIQPDVPDSRDPSFPRVFDHIWLSNAADYVGGNFLPMVQRRLLKPLPKASTADASARGRRGGILKSYSHSGIKLDSRRKGRSGRGRRAKDPTLPRVSLLGLGASFSFSPIASSLKFPCGIMLIRFDIAQPCPSSLSPPTSPCAESGLQQPLTASLYVNYFLRGVDTQDDIVVIPDEYLVFHPHADVVEGLGEV